MIVIPTYNEKDNIRELLTRIRKAAPEVPVLFVDDNSPDGTAGEIESLAKEYPFVTLLKRPEKSGLGSAYRAGFKMALSDLATDFVIEMDADLSHAPEDIPRLVAALKEHDAVVGSRYAAGGRTENWNWFRRLISWAGNLYARFLSGGQVTDATAGFVAYRKSWLSKVGLGDIKSDGYAFQIELKHRLAQAGADIAEIPIVFTERREGKSKFSSKILREGIALPWKLLLGNIAANRLAVALGAAVAILPLLIYAYTAPRTIYLGDSPEFVMAVATAGIPHPPGYPTYMLLAKPFSLLPIGTLAFRVNIFSAVCASATLLLLFLIGRRLFGQLKLSDPRLTTLAAALIPLSLAFSDIFWSQAIMAKMYQLHLLFVAAAVWMLVKFWDRPRASYALWTAFLVSLGFGAHQMILFFAPVFLLGFLIRKLPGEDRYYFHPSITKRVILWSFVMILFGLSAYLYLPVRSAAHPGYQWEDLSAFKPFVRHVFRSEYKDLAAGFDWKYKAEFLASFLQNVFDQFRWLIILALPGLAVLIRQRRVLLLTAGVFALNSLGIILTRSLPFTFDGEAYSSFYYLPAYAMVAIWIGAGGLRLLALKPKAGGVLAVIALVAIPAYFAVANYQRNDLKDFKFLDDYSRRILTSLEPDSVLLISFNGAVNDSMAFSLMYQQKVNGLRQDVAFKAGNDIYPNVDRDALNKVFELDKIGNFRNILLRYTAKQPENSSRPIYATYPVDALNNEFQSHSNGLVYRVKGQGPIEFYEGGLSLKDQSVLDLGYFGRDLLAQYYYAQAAGLLDKGDKEKAHEAFLRAIASDNEVGSEDAAGFIMHRAKLMNRPK